MPDVPTCPSCGEVLPQDDGSDAPLSLNGEVFEVDKLSFRERNQITKLVREVTLSHDPDADPAEDQTGDDWRVAFAIVCARRSNPEFSVEDGVNLTPDELKAAPPTKGARKAKA